MFVAVIDYPPTSHLNHILFNTDISMSDNKIAVSLFWTKVNKIAVSRPFLYHHFAYCLPRSLP